MPTIETVTGWYDRSAEGYDAGHQATQRKYDVIERSLRRLLDGKRALDLGCGTGRLLDAANAARVVGVDLSAEMLRKAKAKSSAVVRADGHHLPFADSSFDAVIAAQGVIRYMDAGRAFQEIARVLTPGGRCAVHQFGQGVGIKGLLLRRTPPPDEFALLDVEDLAKPARVAGLTVDEVELFRSLGRYPHAVRIPARLPNRVSGPLWNHCVLLAHKAGA